MAGLATVIAGAYQTFWTPPNGAETNIGTAEGVHRLQTQMLASPIRAHRYGNSQVDSLYEGLNVFMIIQFKSFIQDNMTIFWPWSATPGRTGSLGRCGSDLAGQLRFVLDANSSASTVVGSAGPATLTIHKAVVAPNHNQEWRLGIVERIVPIVFACYPITPDGSPTLSELKYYDLTYPN